MASIFITYGLLGFPFLFGLLDRSKINEKKNSAGVKIGNKHTYWEWVLVGFSISLGICILRYLRATIKWKETKQYILNKLGAGVDPGSSEALESNFGYYWKSTVFFPGWFLNYFFFPQSAINLFLSYLFCGFLFYTTLYNLLHNDWDRKPTASYTRSQSILYSSLITVGIIIFSILFGGLFTLGKSRK